MEYAFYESDDDDFFLRPHTQPIDTEYVSPYRCVSPLLSPINTKTENNDFMKITLSNKTYNGPDLRIQVLRIVNPQTKNSTINNNDTKSEKDKDKKRLFWTREEDEILKQFKAKGLQLSHPTKSRKQCRERWINHLCPGVNSTPFLKEEDELICKLFLEYGPLWSKIATFMNGRRDNAIKNRWNSFLKKKFELKR
jgi:hypothetical protein